MADDFDPAEFQRRLQQQLAASRQAFDGKYKDELTQLAGLSRADIDAITPGTTDLQQYDALMAVVKEASRVNLSQAALAAQIKQLGDVAVAIADRIPTLAALL